MPFGMAECDPREISFFHHDRAFRFHDPPTPLPHRWIKAKQYSVPQANTLVRKPLVLARLNPPGPVLSRDLHSPTVAGSCTGRHAGYDPESFRAGLIRFFRPWAWASSASCRCTRLNYGTCSVRYAPPET